jgi:transposase
VLTLPPAVRVFLAVEPVDLRKSIDGLAAIVRNQWSGDVYSGHLYVFVSRRRDRVKVLFWDRSGFVVYYKRLERGRFRIQHVASEASSVQLEATELAMLLDGIDFRHVRRTQRWEPPTGCGIDTRSSS